MQLLHINHIIIQIDPYLCTHPCSGTTTQGPFTSTLRWNSFRLLMAYASTDLLTVPAFTTAFDTSPANSSAVMECVWKKLISSVNECCGRIRYFMIMTLQHERFSNSRISTESSIAIILFLIIRCSFLVRDP